MATVKAHEIVLYATNTGSLYETHKQMAREGASQQKWFEHVSGRVMRLYNREVEPARSWPSDRFDAARELKAYYERHIQEGDTATLVARMKEIALGYYTERDGGRWYVITPDHDRIAEEFVDRDNARRFVCWLAGDALPDGWKVTRHGDGRIAYDIEIPGQYSPATIWTRPTIERFPQHAATFPMVAS